MKIQDVDIDTVNSYLCDRDNHSKFPEGSVVVVGYDTSGSYDTDIRVVVRTPDGEFYAMSAGGCSCYTDVDVYGPFDTAIAAGAELGTDFTHEFMS